MRVAILDDYQNVALSVANWSAVTSRAEITVFNDHVEDLARLSARLKDFDIVVLMRSRTEFSRQLLERLPNLKFIASPGMQHIAVDLAAASERGVIVSGVYGTPNRENTVELTWGLILSLIRSIPRHDRAVREGAWQLEPGTTLKGKTLGVLGLGMVGSGVARIGKAFGMHVIAWSQNLTRDRCDEVGVSYADKDALLGDADVISIHLTLSDRTRGLIGGTEIEKMKRSAFLINTSRGPIVDQHALIGALESRRIRGAAVDVYDIEPLPTDHPMRRLPHSVTTPHIGFVTYENYGHFYRGCAEDVAAYLDGAPIRVVNPDVLSSD